jgi:hypothetical protein
MNYRDPRLGSATHNELLVKVGDVRYASTDRPFQQISAVPVSLTPTDLLGQKTALFGMTRTGKSNTTKIILKSVFGLRWDPKPIRVGQIVFDPNGEYANENTQDSDDKQNASAIKNVWASGPSSLQSELKADVITYGLLKHPLDPGRKLMLLNFYKEENLQIGKQIIDSALAKDSTKFISNFRDVVFDPPEPSDHSATTRHARRVLCYQTLLFKAGLEPPSDLKPNTKGLFNKDLLAAMKQSSSSSASTYASAATMLEKTSISWGEALSPRTTVPPAESGIRDAFFQQRQHKTRGACNERSERWKAVFARDLWVNDPTGKRLRGNAVTKDVYLFI